MPLDTVTASSKAPVFTPDAQSEGHNIAQSRAFSIKPSGKMFRTLSATLYTDRIQAIVREIITNAGDAHAVSGTDKAIEVHAPTGDDPQFRVRDYGPGLSHDQVLTIYTTYFESTKEDCVKTVGKFGLGSKSPFSYTDQFFVTSYSDGTLYRYIAAWGADDMPTINLIGSETTDQPNGLEVTVPVQDHDTRTWAQKIANFRHWYTKPLAISGRELPAPDESVPVARTDKERWGFLDCRHNRERSYAIVGGVTYPIDPGAIPNLHPAHGGLLASGIFLRLAVDAVEVAPSREHLSYSEITIASIGTALDAILHEMTEGLRGDLALVATEWELRAAFRPYAKVNHHIRRHLRTALAQEIGRFVPKLEQEDLSDEFRLDPYEYDPLAIRILRRTDHHVELAWSRDDIYKVEPAECAGVVVHQEDLRAVKRAAAFLNGTPAKYVILVRIPRQERLAERQTKRDQARADIEKWQAEADKIEKALKQSNDRKHYQRQGELKSSINMAQEQLHGFEDAGIALQMLVSALGAPPVHRVADLPDVKPERPHTAAAQARRRRAGNSARKPPRQSRRPGALLRRHVPRLGHPREGPGRLRTSARRPRLLRRPDLVRIPDDAQAS